MCSIEFKLTTDVLIVNNRLYVVRILLWQSNAGTTVNTQLLAEVSQCVEIMNGVREGKWKATLNFYKPIFREQANALEFPREFLGISLQEQPNKHYMVIRGQRLFVEAESSIQVIMEKLQSYKTRAALNFEAQHAVTIRNMTAAAHLFSITCDPCQLLSPC
ncbi:Mediator of RNA polymerase II transcription subunit 20a [Capsicum annuum]|nr:Mediator of RNA polymerase II transcription subunit 20a [Capsicum annuum]